MFNLDFRVILLILAPGLPPGRTRTPTRLLILALPVLLILITGFQIADMMFVTKSCLKRDYCHKIVFENMFSSYKCVQSRFSGNFVDTRTRLLILAPGLPPGRTRTHACFITGFVDTHYRFVDTRITCKHDVCHKIVFETRFCRKVCLKTRFCDKSVFGNVFNLDFRVILLILAPGC